jgi:hypothetical protein
VPGETRTIRFFIKNDDLSYGSIWGLNLIFPDGVTVMNTTPFYSTANNEMIFDKLPDCGTDKIISWEGWHWIGIPPYADADGNLDVLNETAWTDVTLKFADSASMEELPVHYEIYYKKHCFTIQPFSYGTVMMENNENAAGIDQQTSDLNEVVSYPNPAFDYVTFGIYLQEPQEGEIRIYDVAGRTVQQRISLQFRKGENKQRFDISQLQAGIYYYSFIGDNIKLTGELMKSD